MLAKEARCSQSLASRWLSDNVIKLSSYYSRKDVKAQSVEPFSLRLCVFARVRFRESLARNPLT
jgi:hypothetical protein